LCVCLFFSVWPLHCLFFDLHLLNTPLIFSNFPFDCHYIIPTNTTL
jgi:hypothetical protein